MVKFSPIRADEVDAYASEILWLGRNEDIAEIRATHGDKADIFGTVVDTIRATPEPLAALDADGTWCIFGVVPLGPMLTPMASPWQLGTLTMNQHPTALIRETKRYLASVRERYPMLVNFVDARNTPSLRYLKAVGFTIDEQPQPFGASGLPFHRFHMGLSQ